METKYILWFGASPVRCIALYHPYVSWLTACSNIFPMELKQRAAEYYVTAYFMKHFWQLFPCFQIKTVNGDSFRAPKQFSTCLCTPTTRSMHWCASTRVELAGQSPATRSKLQNLPPRSFSTSPPTFSRTTFSMHATTPQRVHNPVSQTCFLLLHSLYDDKISHIESLEHSIHLSVFR